MTKKTEEKIVFVGKKNVSNYIVAVMTMSKDSDKVHVKARGSTTSKALDVAVRAKKMYDMEIERIDLDTEVMENKGVPVNVTTVDIVLTKGKV